jgi:hypothetical protein
MFTREELLHWSDCVYKGLLSFYPARFRRHFGAEMAQIFRDCCRSQSKTGNLFMLWIRTAKDIAVSAVAEWRSELDRSDRELDYTGLVDAFMITVVVGTNLIGWGSFAASIMLHVTLPRITQYWNTAATILIGVVTLLLAGLIGTVFAVIVGRSGRTDIPHIKV